MHKFNLGDRVFHHSIGKGDVVSVSDQKNNIRYIVRAFNDVRSLAGNRKEFLERELERSK